MIVYCENNRLLCGSKLGYWKIRLNSIVYFYCSSLYISTYTQIINSVFSKKNKDLFKTDESLIKYVIRCIYFGSASRFRIIGRGYKVYNQINHLLFKLGYSHVINYTLPIYYEVHKKDKNNNFYKVTGIAKSELHSILSNIKSFRIPNVYSKKGVFIKDELVAFKEGKKNFTL